MTTHFQGIMDTMDELLDEDGHYANDYNTLIQAVQHANRSDMEPSWLREGTRNAPPSTPTFSFPIRQAPSTQARSHSPPSWRPSDPHNWRNHRFEDDIHFKPFISRHSNDAQPSSNWDLPKNGSYTHDPENYDHTAPRYDAQHDGWIPDAPRYGVPHDGWIPDAPRYGVPHDGWVPDAPETRSAPGLRVPDDYPPGNATLTYPGAKGELLSIPGLNVELIAERSALLATAFEERRSGPQLNLGTLCIMTAMPLVRYLYSGSYVDSDVWEDVPTSLLLHCKMYHLGNLYDLPELKTQSYLNIIRQCEFGCSSPNKPIDLCAAIAFTFENLRSVTEVTESILHYCISCFLSHGLGKDPEFTSLAYDVRPFHQDLMKICRDRGFDDESAVAIIQMPYKPYLPETYASTEHPAIARFEDLIYHYHGDDGNKEMPVSPTKRLKFTNPTEAASAETGPSVTVKSEAPVFPVRKLRVTNPTEPIMDMSSTPKAGPAPEFAAKAVPGSYKQSTREQVSARGRFDFHLPVHTRANASPPAAEDISSASEDDGLCIGKKRKVPSAAEVSNRSLLSSGESDFEVVSGPESVRSVSDESGDDSDTGTLVDVVGSEAAGKKEEGGSSKLALAKEESQDNGTSGSADITKGESESEWDMI